MATMQIARSLSKPPYRRHAVTKLSSVACTLLTSACLPASPAGPEGSTGGHLPAGAFYLRMVDEAALPVTVASGARIESGFVVADSANPGVVGFGESVGLGQTASVRLATGNARVLGHGHGTGRIAAITWRAGAGAGAARPDSVLWSSDSVIVYRTGAAPSVAGPGHRFIYTRATPADTQ
jgi:hypothetical protein